MFQDAELVGKVKRNMGNMLVSLVGRLGRREGSEQKLLFPVKRELWDMGKGNYIWGKLENHGEKGIHFGKVKHSRKGVECLITNSSDCFIYKTEIGMGEGEIEFKKQTDRRSLRRGREHGMRGGGGGGRFN